MNRLIAILHGRPFPGDLASGNEQGLKEMQKYSSINRAASIAVCFGILLSNSICAFDGVRPAAPRDVALTEDGTLHGYVFTSEQHPVENAQIELRYRGTTVARTTTGAEGDFLITGVRGGAHEIAVGSMKSPVRLWKNGTAPAGAAEGYVVAASDRIIRGQAYDPYYDTEGEEYCDIYTHPASGCGMMDVVALAVMAGAATAVVIAFDNHNDDAPPVIVSP